MKKLLLLSLMASLLFISCSKEDTSGIEELDSYEVSLALEGDMINIDEVPLAKSGDEGKKYYGINVFCMKTDGSESEYTPYAYGVFDNVEKMKITLLTGYKYKFECTSVIEREHKVFIGRSDDGSYNYFGAPFTLNAYTKYCHPEDLNEFQISSGLYIEGLSDGSVSVIGSSDSYVAGNPLMDRYYGVLDGYIPIKNGEVTIFMKRAVFGIKILLNNGLEEGTLSYNMPTGYSDFFPPFSPLDTKMEKEWIFTFRNVAACLTQSNYSEEFYVFFVWTRANGFVQEFSKSFTVKRNVMTVINLTLNGGSNEQGIGIDEEDSSMGTETIDVTYDGGDGSGTTVDPE